MRLLVIVTLLMLAITVRAATPTVTNIANFPSVSVAYTNYVNDLATTNSPVFAGFPLGLQLMPPKWPDAPSLYMTNIVISNIVSGNNDVFTVPTGMRATIWNLYVMATNVNQIYLTLKTNGVYYRIGATSTSSQTGNHLHQSSLVFEQGESVSFNSTSAILFGHVILCVFTNTLGWYSPRVLNLASGDNTIYTVPAGKKAGGVMPENILNGNQPVINYIQSSGGAANVNTFWLPNGYTTSTFLRISTNTFSSGTLGSVALSGRVLQAGEKIVINTSISDTNQFGWITVNEY